MTSRFLRAVRTAANARKSSGDVPTPGESGDAAQGVVAHRCAYSAGDRSRQPMTGQLDEMTPVARDMDEPERLHGSRETHAVQHEGRTSADAQHPKAHMCRRQVDERLVRLQAALAKGRVSASRFCDRGSFLVSLLLAVLAASGNGEARPVGGVDRLQRARISSRSRRRRALSSEIPHRTRRAM
jgi:hypothetical protein